ncbi:hypothetical protein CPC08DRAFT_722268 [Agrocybe pediades]|nr:hypothetical protein CPC08DRAFT_722268 [Agrocybe pediades]
MALEEVEVHGEGRDGGKEHGAWLQSADSEKVYRHRLWLRRDRHTRILDEPGCSSWDIHVNLQSVYTREFDGHTCSKENLLDSGFRGGLAVELQSGLVLRILCNTENDSQRTSLLAPVGYAPPADNNQSYGFYPSQLRRPSLDSTAKKLSLYEFHRKVMFESLLE